MRLLAGLTLVLTLILTGFNTLFAQTATEQLIQEATRLATEAEQLVEAGEYEAAARKYLEAARKFEEAGMPAQAASEYIKAAANFDNAAEELRKAGRHLWAADLFREAADAYGKGASADDSDNDAETNAAGDNARDNAANADEQGLPEYEKVSEDDKPFGIACDPGGTKKFSIDYTWEERLEIGFKEDTVVTEKDDWDDEDEREFDEEYNKEKAEELEALKGVDSIKLENIDSVVTNYVRYQVENKWNRGDYSFCMFECNDAEQQCYVNWHIIRVADKATELYYKTRSSWVNEEDDAPNTAEVVLDLYARYSATVYFEVTCTCLDIPSSAYVEPGWDPYWSDMDFTTHEAKVLAVPPPRGGVPIWIPITAGAAAAGTAIYFITKDDDEPSDSTQTPLMTTPDMLTVPCDGEGTVDVLENDQGDGLEIVSIPSIQEATITQSQPGLLTLTNINTTDDFSFTIVLGDQYGNEAMSLVEVLVETPNIAATDDALETPYETPLSANVLDNDIGPGIVVIDFSPPPEGEMSIGANGIMNFTPAKNFKGDVSATYTIEGPCDLTSEGTITITVHGPDCAFEASISTTPADCGSDNGTASITVDPDGQYTYLWSDGQTAPNVDLPGGTYSVTITSEDGNCVEVYDVEIEELPPDFTADFTTTSANCGQSDGSVTVSITPDDNYTYQWSNGATGQTVNNIEGGEYTVTVTLSGTDCALEFDIEVDEEMLNVNVDFDVTDANCNMADGTASAEVTPDGEYDLEWSNGQSGSSITDVAPGQYGLTVTLSGTECSEEFTVEVGNIPADFSGTITFIEPSCGLEDGTASVEVTPAGEYSYEWNNGSALPVTEDIGAGEYCVTVTDTNGCNIQICSTVNAQDASYITNIQTIPGNCIGEGADIIITTTTPGNGPMQITANGPDGPQIFSAPVGVTSLASFFTVVPGAWTIDVTDSGITDPQCSDQANATVIDNSSIQTVDDAYETVTNQSVSGNLLLNDDGVQLSVTSNTDPSSGSVTVNADGTFEYTPDADFTGQVTFQYTVMDACGNTATATVTIEVNSADCNFTALFDIVDANCGIENGAINTTLDPPGNYTFIWSNGETTQSIQDIPAGSYTVTITSLDISCDKEFDLVVGQVDNTYLTNISTTSGDCSGNGEIEISITTPGDGPIVVEVDGPGVPETILLDPGTHLLSGFFNILPGNYIITLYDEGAGQSCSETADAVVNDDTPLLTANDDILATQAGQSVDGNMLDNDSGLDLEITDVFGITGGIVVWDADGSFTFTPDPGFSGQASFFYTVADACGDIAEAEVIITVEEVPCAFTIDFEVTNANCGLTDGVVITTVDPPGNYTYQWSDGSTGADLIGVAEGDYGLTVTDNNLGCDLEFNTTVGEDPSDYISNLTVTQPSCPSPGEISFTITTPGTGAIEMDVTHPNGTLNTIVPEGLVTLSDYVEITPGDYTITITEVAAGDGCSNTFTVTLDPLPPGPTIAIEAIIPPSDPTAEDGAIIVAITAPTTPPYTIILNGLETGNTPDPVFSIEGLGAGFYSIQIRDANGCESNVLDVEVPITGEELQLSVTTLALPASRYKDMLNEQPAWSENTVLSGSALNISIPYVVKGQKLITDLRFAPVYQYSGQGQSQSIFSSLDARIVLMDKRKSSYGLTFSTGIGTDLLVTAGSQLRTQPHWSGQFNFSSKLNRFISLTVSAEITGWQKVHLPTLSFGVFTEFRK